MSPPCQFSFGPFRLDSNNAGLWRGAHAVALTPKAFAVLQYLLEHAGELAPKEAFFAAVWHDAVVSDGTLKVCIAEIRRALQDDARTPQFIKTEHRRGYRFICPVQTLQSETVELATSRPTRSLTGPAEHRPLIALSPQSSSLSPTCVVGREADLERLHGWFQQAIGGARQIIFVTGEAGIGKTTLVDRFLDQVATQAGCWLARGQCIEHYGAGEAYLPVLEAIEQLCGEPAHGRIVELLQQQAPTWLVQMPWLLSAAELEALQHRVQGASRERMLREMAVMLEALTAESPLVLMLEDLHCSDYATLDLIAWLARRREPARLMVIGTYRPVEVILHGHPLKALKQELQIHRQCEELLLDSLPEAAVARYLAARCVDKRLCPEAIRRLACAIYQRTDGHPLFMVTVVDYAEQQGWLAAPSDRWDVQAGTAAIAQRVPDSLRQMIEQQLAHLSTAERSVLEAASVVGVDFTTAAVAAGTQVEVDEVEQRCEELTRRGQFLLGNGIEEWPDGTAAGRYRLRHVLYQQVVYERLPVGQRMRLHRRVGERQEAGYGGRAHERAVELAGHFEQGRDYERAVRYRRRAAENALGRWAYHEAISHLTSGLELLNRLPDTPDRARQELDYQTALGLAVMVTKGFAAPEVGTVYARAAELCQQIGEVAQLFPLLWQLRQHHSVRGETQTAYELAERLLSLANGAQDTDLLLQAHFALGNTLYYRGEPLPARTHLEQAIALYQPQQYRSHLFRYAVDPGTTCLRNLAWTLWLLGYPDQALEKSQAALRLAQESMHPPSLVAGLVYGARVHQHRREAHLTQQLTEAAMPLAREHGFTQRLAAATILHGWALAVQDQIHVGLAEMRQGLDAFRATGAEDDRPYWLALLADVPLDRDTMDAMEPHPDFLKGICHPRRPMS